MNKLTKVILALIGVLAAGLLILSLSIDGIVKSSIENTTSEMLDTPVSVDNVSISIFNGSGTIDGITINNPDGFSDNPAVKLQQISMEMKLSTLLSDTVVVNEIRIQNPELYFEQKTSGNNFNTLNDRFNEGPSSETSLIVDYLLVENGRITLTTDIGGEKTAESEFSRIEIEGIGRSGNNTIEQTLQQILEPILQQAAQEAIKRGLMDAAKDKLKDLLDS